MSLAEAAQLLETQANVVRTSLDVRDCVLRAPFDGEIGTRSFDPGAFVHPGAAIVSVVDRDTMRVTVDAPEKDFDALAPSTVGPDRRPRDGQPTCRRRSRAARPGPTRRRARSTSRSTCPIPQRQYPVGTTAIVHVDVGKPVPATEVPIYAATQDEGKAKLFVVDHDVAHAKTLPVTGEVGGGLYFALAALPAGSLVVTEGRALLSDGDRVLAHVEAEAPTAARPRTTRVRGRAAEATGGRCDRPVAPQPAREPDARHRGDRLRRGRDAAHVDRHVPRPDAAGARRRDARARAGRQGRREDADLAHREVRERDAGRRARPERSRGTTSASRTCGSTGGPTSTRAQTLVQQQVQFAMAAVPKSLGVIPPFVLQFDPTNAPVLQVTVSGGGLTGPQLYDYAHELHRAAARGHLRASRARRRTAERSGRSTSSSTARPRSRAA